MIVFAHLLNDRSGSPRVLCSSIAALRKQDEAVHLFVGSDGSGCLDEIGVSATRYWYRRTPYRLLTLFTFLFSQGCLFFRLLHSDFIEKNAVIYVNTLLPFGAALYGRITGRPVVYHLHEISVRPVPLRWFLTAMAHLTARSLIYVSDFHRAHLPLADVPAKTVYNALDAAFLKQANLSTYQHQHTGCFRVLMLAALRDYKGVPEFLSLANQFAGQAEICFDLVANEEEAVIQHYFTDKTLPSNVTVYSRTSNPSAYYAKASLVVNLSRPDQCVETFGLTLLEAMAFGIPVIAPPVGGPAELVSDGVEGFLINCRQVEALAAIVLQLANDGALCIRLSEAARQKAACFTPEKYALALREALIFHADVRRAQ
jgi:glycosyltransferase involved in cell wall biosynthesis